MTKREAAIVSAYTGILIGNFSEMQAYAEDLFGRPIWTHEFGAEHFAGELKELSREDFIRIVVEG